MDMEATDFLGPEHIRLAFARAGAELEDADIDVLLRRFDTSRSGKVEWPRLVHDIRQLSD